MGLSLGTRVSTTSDLTCLVLCTTRQTGRPTPGSAASSKGESRPGLGGAWSYSTQRGLGVSGGWDVCWRMHSDLEKQHPVQEDPCPPTPCPHAPREV